MRKFFEHLIANSIITLMVAGGMLIVAVYLMLSVLAVAHYGFLGALGVMLVTLITFSAIESALDTK